MRPGDVVTCGNPACGALARATTTAGERWRVDWPLILPWPDGRDEVTHAQPERCLTCHERFMALGRDVPPPRPPRPMRTLRSAGDGPLNETTPALPPPAPASGTRPVSSAPRQQLTLL